MMVGVQQRRGPISMNNTFSMHSWPDMFTVCADFVDGSRKVFASAFFIHIYNQGPRALLFVV